MTSLDCVIRNIFNNDNYYSRIRRLDTTPVTVKKYMEIPIDSDVFELPLLAFDDFRMMYQNRKESDMIVACLYSCGQKSQYRSFDSIIKDVLSARFDRHLCRVEIANSPFVYYATFGAIFDMNFTPLMMMSWIMERKANTEGVVKCHYKKPLLRLNPYPCLNKEDALQKFICGRLMTTTLGQTIHAPSFYGCDSFIEQSDYLSFNHVRVEIDECPFTIKSTDVPSISVTNEDLLQLAEDHIDEILQ